MVFSVYDVLKKEAKREDKTRYWGWFFVFWIFVYLFAEK